MRVSVTDGARRVCLGALLAVGLVVAQGSLHPSIAHAAGASLTYSSSVTYDVRPARGLVHATAIVSVDAQTGDEVAPSRAFWDATTISLPPLTKNVVATLGARALALKVISATASETVVSVAFGRRLVPSETFAFQLQFDIVDDWSSPTREIRITKSIASFPVFAIASGSKGSTVTVRFPASYEVTQETGQLMRQRDPSTGVVFMSGLTEDPGLFAWFTAETKPQMVARSIEVGPLALTIVSFDDDPLWAYQVEQLVRGGYSVLRDDVGLGDVRQMAVTVVEAGFADSQGKTGSYDMATNTIRLAYNADATTFLHELAHLWINPRLVADPWVDEGFASYYADEALAQMDLRASSPALTDRKLGSRVPLSSWVPPDGLPTIQDEYVYAASLEVAREIAEVATEDGLRQVWRRIESGPALYQPTDGRLESPPKGPIDWRGFLDYLDETLGDGAAPQLQAIWTAWVVEPTEARQLVRHAELRNEYKQVVGAAGTWQLPPEVRQSMRDWNLVRAETQLESLRTVLDASEKIQTDAVAEGTTVPAALQRSFETSVDEGLRESTGELQALAALARAARAAEQTAGRPADPAAAPNDSRVRLLVSARLAFSSGQWPQAITLADTARLAWEKGAGPEDRNQVTATGAVLAGIVLATFVLFVLVVPYVSRRRRGVSRAAETGAATSSAAAAAIETSRPAPTRPATGHAATSHVATSHAATSHVAITGPPRTGRSPTPADPVGPAYVRLTRGPIDAAGMALAARDGDSREP